MATVREYTPEEVAKHSSITDCWVIVDGRVCDVSSMLSTHVTIFRGGQRRENRILPCLK